MTNVTRRGFLQGLSTMLLWGAVGGPAAAQLSTMVDDLSGTTTTHAISEDDFYCYYVGLRIVIGPNAGRIVSMRGRSLDILWDKVKS